jgi:protein-disulfide isomerase
VLGSADASVAIVEFSDFQCPYCRRHHVNTSPGLVDKYVQSGSVKYVFVDFPLSFHSDAESAAVAAACADKQGAFWKMHDLLFASQAALGTQTYRKLAADLNLDDAEFARCLEDPAMTARVNKHVALGESVGVSGTPAFLIGRVRDGKLVDAVVVSGAQPLSSFERVLAPLLEGTQARQ